MKYIGLQKSQVDLPPIVVDLGYSKDRPTCGVMTSLRLEPCELQFGDAINETAKAIRQLGPSILVMEAVLSTFHQKNGNPDIRGDFEKGRGWYYGPGVTTLAAAARFLAQLRRQIALDTNIYLAEAFLSFKKTRSPHSTDAATIYQGFWNSTPVTLADGTECITDFIDGIPSVRVFRIN